MSKKLSIAELKKIVEEFKKIHCPKLTAGKKALMEFAVKHNLLSKNTVVEEEPAAAPAPVAPVAAPVKPKFKLKVKAPVDPASLAKHTDGLNV